MVDFAQARRQMVDTQLRTAAITDRRVLSAMGAVAREAFVPDARKELAYIDDVQPLGNGRYLASAAPFARMVQLAAIESEDRILDVGCGTGYSTAVLAQLGASVVGVESDTVLAASARHNLGSAGVTNATVIEASLEAGAGADAAFDVILVEGMVDMVPGALLAQLKDGGRLVALIRSGAAAVVNVFVKSGRAVAARQEFNASLPPLASAPKAESFVF